MDGMLYIDGRSFNWDFRGLWWLILEHTGCTRSTARILLELTEASREGAIDHLVVYPSAGSVPGVDPDWRARITHRSEAALEVEPSAAA